MDSRVFNGFPHKLIINLLRCERCGCLIRWEDETIFGELPFHKWCFDMWWIEEKHAEDFREALNRMEKALRYNEGKVPYSFLLELPNSLAELCRVFEAGAKKYARGNWQKGGKPDEEYLDSAMRHLMALGRGEVIDPECGTHHAANAVWNLLVLMELNYFRTYEAKITDEDIPF